MVGCAELQVAQNESSIFIFSFELPLSKGWFGSEQKMMLRIMEEEKRGEGKEKRGRGEKMRGEKNRGEEGRPRRNISKKAKKSEP